MGPLALLGLLGGGAILASVMKQKGLDFKKKKPSKKQVKNVAQDIIKKKKEAWQTEPNVKKREENLKRAEKNKKNFLEKLEQFMN